MYYPTFVQCLQFLGLEPLYTQDPDPYVREEYEKHSLLKQVVNWLYPALIWNILWFHVILIFYGMVVLDERENIAYVFFLLNQPIQYAIAFVYFRGQSLKRIYESKAENKNVEKKERWRCLPGEETLFRLWFSVSIVAIIFFLILLYIIPLSDPSSLLRRLNLSVVILAGIFVPISILYGKMVIVLNTFVFFFSFFQQLQKIQSLRHKIQKREWRKNNKKSSVAQLCYWIIDCRYTLMRMIQKLEMIYVYSTLLGGLAVGVMINYKITSPSLLGECVQFTMTQVTFLIVIYLLGNEREELLCIVRHRDFASSYIILRNEFCQVCLDIEKGKESHTFPQSGSDTDIFVDHTEENPNEEELEDSFEKIHRESFILRPSREHMSVPLTDVVVENPPGTQAQGYRKRTLGGGEEEGVGDDDYKKKIHDLLESSKTFGNTPFHLDKIGCTLKESEFIRCIYEWVSNTGSTMDWIILNTVLNEEWASFSLIGIQFGDTNILEKALGLTTLLISISSQIGDLHWLF